MTSVDTVRLVAEREVRQRVRSRAFKAVMVVIAVLIVGVGFLRRALADAGPTRYDVAVVGVAPGGFERLLTAVSHTAEIEVDVVRLDDNAAADALRDGDVDAVLVADDGLVRYDRSDSSTLTSVLNAAWQRAEQFAAAADAGLDQATIDRVLSPPALQVDIDRPADSVGNAVGLITAVLLFIALQALGGMILTGVVEEKTTAVVEVLLARVPAHRLLLGKLIGIGVIGMVQLVVALVAAIVALRITGDTIPRDVWVALPTTLVWFVVGFSLYATLFALAGSLVSRVEDAQTVALPITIVFTSAYITVFAVAGDPGGRLARILSVLPPIAPLLMPLRMATGAASIVEIVAALVLVAITAYVVVRLAGKVYSTTLLHRGTRMRWRHLVRTAR